MTGKTRTIKYIKVIINNDPHSDITPGQLFT